MNIKLRSQRPQWRAEMEFPDFDCSGYSQETPASDQLSPRDYEEAGDIEERVNWPVREQALKDRALAHGCGPPEEFVRVRATEVIEGQIVQIHLS